MSRGWGLAALGAAATALLLAAAWVIFSPMRDDAAGPPPLPPFSLDGRPQSGRHLFDYAGSLEHYEEGAQRFLRRMGERFHIEAVMVTLPAMPANTDLGTLAADLVNRWRIGSAFEGRSLLLLLVEQDRQVKLEVSYELEDVFTDAFSGYIEDLQLRPYYLADDIGTGLVAVMEELEQRAQLKRQGEYTPGTIAGLDNELVSGGAGARRALERYEQERQPVQASTPALATGARSPREAWRIMLAKWAGKGADIDVDVYTEMTRLAMGDPNQVDPRTLRSLAHWQNADYQVLQDEEHAVIWFGNIKGWDNAPFLFCRTPVGWKFDIVHQRRLVVMGENPDWMIEQGDYPYVDLLADARQSTGKDLPLSPEDRYSCQNDAELAREIRALEQARRAAPNDLSVLLPLARISIITGRRPAYVQPLLKQLRKLAPDNPEVYRYSAIYNVNAFFQYKTAMKDMRAYLELRPKSAFGYSLVGFLHYRLGDYQASIKALEQAVELAPDNVYAYALLARDYALLYRKEKADSRRRYFREQARAMLTQAAQSPTPNAARVARLRRWLEHRLN